MMTPEEKAEHKQLPYQQTAERNSGIRPTLDDIRYNTTDSAQLRRLLEIKTDDQS